MDFPSVILLRLKLGLLLCSAIDFAGSEDVDRQYLNNHILYIKRMPLGVRSLF